MVIKENTMFSVTTSLFLAHIKNRVIDLMYLSELTYTPFSVLLFQKSEHDPYGLTEEYHKKSIRLICIAMKLYPGFSGNFIYPVNIMSNMSPQAVYMMFRGKQFNKNVRYGKEVNNMLEHILNFVNVVGEICVDGDLMPSQEMAKLINRPEVVSDITFISKAIAKDNTSEQVITPMTNIEKVMGVLLTDTEIHQVHDIIRNYTN